MRNEPKSTIINKATKESIVPKKTIVAIIVYNRFENLKLWLECWDKCDKENTDLVVIHNDDRIKLDDAYSSICKKHGVEYVNRKNKGMDIGALKDLCTGKLFDIPYDNLIWITDDTIPMSKDFVKSFTSLLSDKVGLSCMEISKLNSPLHVRTTGFCISKQVAEKLTFPDQIVTKEDCYQFEHRGGKATLMKQVEAMGLKCVMVSDLNKSPLWDTGNRAHLKRMAEHKKVFADKKGDKVVFMCPVYHNYPQIISSLIAQTHQNWELYLIHDGPGKMELPNDPRVHFECTKERVGNYGHQLRSDYIKKLKDKGDYLIISNVDNYYMPEFLTRAINTIEKNDKLVAVYPAQIVHNYTGWQVMNCRLARGYIDSGQVMVKMEVANDIGWNSLDHSADWFYFLDIAKKHGAQSFGVFQGCHFVHN